MGNSDKKQKVELASDTLDQDVKPDTKTAKEQPIPTRRSLKDWIQMSLPLVTAILISISVIILITQYKGYVEKLRGYGYLGIFIIGFLGNATVILPAPSLAFTVALGGIFNPLLVGLAAGAGEALGELVGYMAGTSGNTIIEHQDYYETVQHYMERYGARTFLILAAIPNPLFDVAGIAAGLVRFPIDKFLLSVWAGKTIKAILFAGAGWHFLQ